MVPSATPLLIVVKIEDRRPVTGSEIAALVVQCRRIVNLEEEFQQRPVVRLRRVIDDLDGLRVTRMIAIRRPIISPSGIANSRRKHSRLLANQILHTPETSACQYRLSRVRHSFPLAKRCVSTWIVPNVTCRFPSMDGAQSSARRPRAADKDKDPTVRTAVVPSPAEPTPIAGNLTTGYVGMWSC